MLKRLMAQEISKLKYVAMQAANDDYTNGDGSLGLQ